MREEIDAMSDPRTVVNETRMSPRQWGIVSVMTAISALDGFDVLSIAFAAPGIAKEWGIGREALGVVLSIELVGMGFGSVLLGRMADRIGRRPTILACLTIIAVGMWFTTTSGSPVTLAIWRLVTGLGIGGMLTSINSVTAEISSLKGRSLAMSVMVTGYSVGATLGGIVAGVLLANGSWRSVFDFGAVSTAIFIPIVALLVPETPAFYLVRRGPDALDRINASLRKLALPIANSLPPIEASDTKSTSMLDIFKPDLVRVTLPLALGFSFHMITVYYLLKWSPKLIADLGYTQSEAAGVLVWTNIGGILGGALFGFAMYRFGPKWPTFVMLLASTITIVIFGFGSVSLLGWKIAVFFAGLTTSAAMVGFYSLFAKGFPTVVRATGTGFAIGAGRVGAAGSPILAGLLYSRAETGDVFSVSIVMALGSIVAAGMLLMLDLKESETKISSRPLSAEPRPKR